ncbi:phospholipid scramblase 1 [Lambiella insularis]|nr:phospholipid scramblase 1 [Lambiella insularis]
MVNWILITFLIVDIIFLNTAGLLLTVAILFKSGMVISSVDAATMLLLQDTPLGVAFLNAGLIFFTFLLSIPGAVLSKRPIILRIVSYLIVVCAIISLAVGLEIWFTTLQTGRNLSVVWAQQTSLEQSLLQQQFQCCGYLNSTTPLFVVDNICPNAMVAATMPGCLGPFAAFANARLDIVFTTMFGIVALDGVLFLCTLVVLKDRAQKERYRLIDEKSGLRGI